MTDTLYKGGVIFNSKNKKEISIILYDNWNESKTVKAISQSRPLGSTIHAPVIENLLPVDNS